MQYRYVFSQRLAGYLMQNGFVLLRMNTNLDDKKKHVFLFKDSSAISKAIESYNKIFKERG